MKKINGIFALILSLACLVSCTKTEQVFLEVSVSSLSMDAKGSPVTFTVHCSGDWTIIHSGDIPLNVSPSSGKAGQTVTVTLSANENNTGNVRTALVSISGGHLDRTVNVTQINSTIAGKARILQKGKASRPPVIFFTGDGYTNSQIEDGGLFEQNVKEAIGSLFAIEPYASMKELFTIVQVAVPSKESGMSNKAGSSKDTFYKCVWEGGKSTSISCDYDLAISTITGAASQLGIQIDEKNLFICMPINVNDVYAGTCYTTLSVTSATPPVVTKASCIGMIPVYRGSIKEGQFAKVLSHEFGGHGIGRLADEYQYYYKAEKKEEYDKHVTTLRDWHSYGYNYNVSETNDPASELWPSDCPWPALAKDSDYDYVGYYQGAYEFKDAFWRSEQTSCMIDNILYFNAVSRYEIMKRVYGITGESFDIAKFKSLDKAVPPAATKVETSPDFRPLGEPVLEIKYLKMI